MLGICRRQHTVMLAAILAGAVASGPAAASSGDEDADSPRNERPEGIQLPGHLRLNGKFDLAYERTGYTDDPSEGRNAIRNDHHFLFLTREGAKDPFVFTAEFVDLTFYEAGAEFELDDWNLDAEVRGGKLVVPFGAEPTFHHSYGGLSGFEQTLLPTIWTRHGLTGNVTWSRNGWRLRNDAYAIHGYQLSGPDAVLDPQTDFSPFDDATIAFGDRVSVAFGPWSLWYSLYVNKLDFDQNLVMQSLDLVLWRIADLPVLRELTLKAGAYRADVVGSGAGGEYYHFGDFVELRYYVLDWLYVQGRTGLHTFDNRDGFTFDGRRADEQDGTAHTAEVVVKSHGFLAQLQHIWNLEKANEVDDDLLRLRLGYEF